MWGSGFGVASWVGLRALDFFFGRCLKNHQPWDQVLRLKP